MKRVVLATVLLVLGMGCAWGADEKKQTKYEVVVEENIAYKDRDADSVRHKLDLYLPRGAKNYPVFFFIHGGAWRGGSKNGFGRHGKMFASRGIAFVAINYRLSPRVKHPEHIKDVASAFAWAHANLGKRGADLKQVYVSGHSAGGHLAALLATDESYLKEHKLSPANIRGVVPISGVFQIRGIREAFGDDGKNASPQNHIRKDLPPFLILYAEKEIAGLDRQAEAFGKALKKAGAKAEVKKIEDRNHGSIMFRASSPGDEVAVAIFDFIRANSDSTKKD